MGTSPTKESTARSLVARALDVQAGRLDVLRARGWVAVGAGTVIVDALAFVAGNRGEGVVGIAVGATAALWFALRSVSPSRGGRALSAIDLLVELGFGPAYLALMALFAPALRAAVSPGPTLLLAGALIISIFRLEPLATAAIGVVGGALVFLVRALLVLPALRELGIPDEQPFTLLDQAIACSSLGFAGMVSSFVSYGLRSAIGSAVSIAREQDLFGKYRLEHEIASGGMGVVWAATYCPEGGFERPAAVKLVHPHLARDRSFIDAFRREAELCARLVHPNVVQVFDFGRVGDRYFLAMEHVDGMTLRQLMNRARGGSPTAPGGSRSASGAPRSVPPVVVGAVGRGVLAALAYAHRDARSSAGAPLRVVHRDIAAANILIDRAGTVKLTDFGIARVADEGGVVHTATVVGHADTMSPEQVSAGPLDERTDLFSTGVVLWELLCGRALFRRNNEAATLHAIMTAPVPPPSSIDASLGAWDAFFVTALARDPALRFSSARAMADALQALPTGSDDDVARFAASLDAAPGHGSEDDDTIDEQTARQVG